MRRPSWLALALSAGLASAAAVPVRYSRGEYSFEYPADLIVAQDYVYGDASAPGSKHVVVLRHRDAQSGDLRFIEINMLMNLGRRETCADYSVCRVVDGVVIGTNSQDPDLRQAFETVVTTFQRRG